MEKNKDWLATCCREIEGQLGWGNPSAWTNDDFEHLSEIIFNRTGTRLSLSTLKRIWGRVAYQNFPNSATLNTLASFLGFPDWRAFCTAHQNGAFENAIAPDKPSGKTHSRKIPLLPKAGKWRVLAIATLPLALAVAMLGHPSADKSMAAPAYHYQLSSRKTGDNLPNSVVFFYDAAIAGSQKVAIQQSWDTTLTESVDPSGHLHTAMYYYPGYFDAKLVVNGQIVKETPVYIETQGWMGIAERRPMPLYFKDSEIRRQGLIGISALQLAQALGTTDFNNRWLEFDNLREFPGMDGSDFIFSISLRNTATPVQSLCRKARIIIRGTGGAIVIPLAMPGCIAELNLHAGDSVISGKDHDLSAFGCDFSNFQQVKCQVRNHVMRISLNDRLILTVAMQRSIGKIVGVRALFEGPGLIRQMALESGGRTCDLMQN